MTAEIGSKAQIPNPALKPLEAIVGEWRTAGLHPMMPDTTVYGRTSFAWQDGGAFLVCRSEVDHPQFPSGIAIFGSDDMVSSGEMSRDGGAWEGDLSTIYERAKP